MLGYEDVSAFEKYIEPELISGSECVIFFYKG